jgi:MerR family transcriptional regulator, light-induced transcriptional regulator
LLDCLRGDSARNLARFAANPAARPALRVARVAPSAHTESMPGPHADEAPGSAVDIHSERTLTVAVVARRLGVAPATLRTWARRYELGPSRHTAGSHRRYTAEDFARLVVMRRLTHEGIAPGEAARVALETPAGSLGEVGRAAIGVIEPGSWQDGPGAAPPAYLSLARVVPIQDARRVARGLHRAAVSMDARGIAELLQRQIAQAGVVATWDDVVVPVLDSLGRRWEATGEGVEVEHLFAEAVAATLTATASRLAPARDTSRVLLCCASGEQHSLPLYAVSAALAERGLSSRVLGAQLPVDALSAAVRRTGPAAVLIYGAMPIDPDVVDQVLRRSHPTARFLLGGPGWAQPALPPYAEFVQSLGRAVHRIHEIVVS